MVDIYKQKAKSITDQKALKKMAQIFKALNMDLEVKIVKEGKAYTLEVNSK
jgi:hypothetical protein